MSDMISARVDPSTGLLGSPGQVSAPQRRNGPSNGMFNPKQFGDMLGGGEEAAGAEALAGGGEALAGAGEAVAGGLAAAAPEIGAVAAEAAPEIGLGLLAL